MEPSDIRAVFLEAFEAAVSSTNPVAAVAGELASHPVRAGRVRVVAIGKAAPAMCRGAAEALGERLVGGIAVSDHTEPVPKGIRLMIGAHPFPETASLEAGRAVLSEAGRTDHDLLLVLVSGGGSALAEVPAGVLTIEDLAKTQQTLMNAAVPIEELNTVRRHLSLLKNGGVAKAAGSPIRTILISDVIDAPASAIASGPTLSDATTPADAIAVLEEHGLADNVPAAVLGHLGQAPDPEPAPEHPWVTVADGPAAAGAAAVVLSRAGLRTRIVTTRLRGESADQSFRFLSVIRPGEAGIATGETTVHVTGDGSGGRNQHAALAAAIAISGQSAVMAALGTDGVDGPTTAAGAIVDGGTAGRVLAAGIDPTEALQRCDSNPTLASAGDLVVTGPTGTNVGDLWMAWKG